MKYTFSIKDPAKQFLGIRLEITQIEADKIKVQLPSWRPGRYELANFSKNIRNFKVLDVHDKPVPFRKLTKDLWEIDTNGANQLYIDYKYYAADLNAGSTWLDDSQLYVNPVNCCLYVPDRIEEDCEVVVDVPYPYELACGLEKVAPLEMKATDFHELADSPFIASPTLQHEEYECNGVLFHIWFQGEIKPNWAKVQLDFERFTAKQIEAFGDFPVREFHFLYQITPYRSYHGVEHTTSTVCQLGPGYDVMGKRYVDFLGVSSHELYHAWNVKTIRPEEMLPYDYTRENYSRLGYVYEGVTTYMGDKFLFSSGVFDDTQYFKELGAYVERHMHNGGRFNLSVTESSFDTWLDGYEPGIPNRKTSIYTEGCLFSFILDVKLKTANPSGGGLDQVMRELYELAKKGKGYTEEIFKEMASRVAGEDVSDLFDQLVHQPVSYDKELKWALHEIGLELKEKQDKSWSGRFGLKGTYVNGQYKVAGVALNSDADNHNINRGDLIVSLNGFQISDDLDKWLEHFGKGPQELGVIRHGRLGFINIDPKFEAGYRKYTIRHLENANQEQKDKFGIWKNE